MNWQRGVCRRENELGEKEGVGQTRWGKPARAEQQGRTGWEVNSQTARDGVEKPERDGLRANWEKEGEVGGGEWGGGGVWRTELGAERGFEGEKDKPPRGRAETQPAASSPGLPGGTGVWLGEVLTVKSLKGTCLGEKAGHALG